MTVTYKPRRERATTMSKLTRSVTATAAAVAVSSSSPFFSHSSSHPILRCNLPPRSVSLRPRRHSSASSAAAGAAESAGRPLLEVRGLTASVKETGVQILTGVDLTIREGEIHVVMGTNGSGKSTLTKGNGKIVKTGDISLASYIDKDGFKSFMLLYSVNKVKFLNRPPLDYLSEEFNHYLGSIHSYT